MGWSKILAVIGICLGWLIPIAGVTLGIVGLVIRKQEGREARDKILNVISIGLAVIFWILWAVLLFK